MRLPKVYLWFSLLFCCFSCGQEKDNNMEEITLENIVEKWQENIKHYEVEPLYKIHHGGNCNYEILVNDFPVYKSYDGFKSLTGERINRAILKSGKQTLTIKVYPIQEGEMLVKEHNAYVKVVEVDKQTDQLEELGITSLVLPSDVDGGFVGAGLPYYEKTIEFEAEVPYELTGWSESEDLSKMDQDDLQKMVEDKLKKEATYFIKKNELLYESLFNQFNEKNQMEYERENDLKQILDEQEETINYASDIQIPENVVMKLYGNNRLVTLEYISGKRIGKSFFDINMRKEDLKGVSRGFMYLHMPKGSNKLEIIR